MSGNTTRRSRSKGRSREVIALLAAARALLESRSAADLAGRAMADVVARYDPQLRHLFVSPAALTFAGLATNALVGKTNREAGLPAKQAEALDQALRRAFASGEPQKLGQNLPGQAGPRHFDCRLLPEKDATGEVVSVLAIARDITDLKLAYEAEKRARYVDDDLREATLALTRSLDRETVLTTLLDRLRRMVPFDRASVMLIEEASRISVRAIYDGSRVLPLAPNLRTEFDPSEHPLVHRILATGAPVLIADVRSHPGWSLPFESSQLETAAGICWMGVPLFARGDVAGLFALTKKEAGYFNQEHVRLAEAMSSQASVAVENAVLFEQMQASSRRMQSLSRRLVEVQESERRHIARELHDEAGQALVSLRYGLRLLEREIDGGEVVTGRVAELMQRTDAVIDGIHRLAADLRPASLDHLGLESALRQYARTAGAKFGLTLRFKATGFTEERLPTVVETALFRVVQEAMTNVVRHAKATRVDILLEHRGDRVMVMVEDDGVGFDPVQVARRGGDRIGLLGLRERAEALGGTLTIESSPGSGTTIVVEVASADPHTDS